MNLLEAVRFIDKLVSDAAYPSEELSAFQQFLRVSSKRVINFLMDKYIEALDDPDGKICSPGVAERVITSLPKES